MCIFSYAYKICRAAGYCQMKPYKRKAKDWLKILLLLIFSYFAVRVLLHQ